MFAQVTAVIFQISFLGDLYFFYEYFRSFLLFKCADYWLFIWSQMYVTQTCRYTIINPKRKVKNSLKL